QLKDREVGRRFAIGHRGTLQHPPALNLMGVHQFVDQARLAHTGIPHEPHDLPVPPGDLLQDLGEEGAFPHASHEPAQRPLAVHCQRRTLGPEAEHDIRPGPVAMSIPHWLLTRLHLEPALDEASHWHRHENLPWLRLSEPAHRLRQRLRDGEHPGRGVTGPASYQYLAPVHRLAYCWPWRLLPSGRHLGRHLANAERGLYRP